MDKAAIFNEYRSFVFAIAYRMLGSVMDAEDIVQEAYLRWQKSDEANLESPKAFLSTVATRLCIDQLRSARRQRETYLGPWLPEPTMEISDENPEEQVDLADSLSIAFLVLLEQLSPTERAVYLLRESFGYDYFEIAQIVNKSESNCRQIFVRARRNLIARRPRFAVSQEQCQKLVREFSQACLSGNVSDLVALFHQDISLWTDGGGKVTAATRPISGSENVSKFLIGVLRKNVPRDLVAEVAAINGQPGLLGRLHGSVHHVVAFDFDEDRIRSVYVIVNPDKLKALN